ncbi:hypothetical protein ONS95_013312 [Cadophora gregata]|uniref:uncharacterized protein n=1 Tax=Cadophora gregata TaxID=51156 RepID=UPI0026DC8093|nr:uncharacterized protein ONS95_013312 [Cadophora gregata]KAK0116290.1 hypothetical protein ONS95_013312 [Cadophora gregata]
MDQAALQFETNAGSSGRTSCSNDIRKETEQLSTTTLHPQSSNDMSPATPRTCQWAGCPDKRVFRQESAFRRHMNKHERPYKCTTSNCKAREFTNPGDLKRHQRTVHSKGAFFCPISSCKRHARGFGRKDNRDEHLKRVHSQDVPPTSDSPESQTPDSEGDIREAGISVTDEIVLGVSVEGLQRRTPSLTASKLPWVAKLQELKGAKAAAIAKVNSRFDKDIEALERVLSLS